LAPGTRDALKTWAANATSLQMYAKWSKPMKEPAGGGGQGSIARPYSERTDPGVVWFRQLVGWNALDLVSR
jgi:hypothetical protein